MFFIYAVVIVSWLLQKVLEVWRNRPVFDCKTVWEQGVFILSDKGGLRLRPFASVAPVSEQ